jgi:hypothetical protein
VSFHVEVRRSFHHARLFNLSEEQLRARVLDPWTSGATVELGDREWSAADSKLTVLQGRELNTAELALGQGWNNAAKVAEDVTGRLLARAAPAAAHATVAVLADSQVRVDAMSSLLSDLGLEVVAWDVVQARALAGAWDDAAVGAAVVVVDQAPTPELALAIGLAIGALRGKVVLVQGSSTAVPSELAQLGHLRIDPNGQAWIHALAARLRGAGCTLRPRPGWDAPGRFSMSPK